MREVRCLRVRIISNFGGCLAGARDEAKAAFRAAGERTVRAMAKKPIG
jgi:hypothetical protein